MAQSNVVEDVTSILGPFQNTKFEKTTANIETGFTEVDPLVTSYDGTATLINERWYGDSPDCRVQLSGGAYLLKPLSDHLASKRLT